MNKTTNSAMIDILSLQKAFNLYREKFREFDKNEKIIEILNSPGNEAILSKPMTPETFRKYFPRDPENTDEEMRPDSKSKLTTFLLVISIVTESKGETVRCEARAITLKGERFTALIPLLDSEGKFELIKSKSFKIFYWSKKFKAVNEGDLVLKEDKAYLKIKYKNDDGLVTDVLIQGLFVSTGATFYINHLKRPGIEGSFTISQIVFQKSEFHDISIGVFATASYISKKPYSGLMVLVSKETAISKDIIKLIEYILYCKRFDISISSFSSKWTHRLDSLPAEVKMWLQVKDKLVGKYKGYFANSQQKRFETCLIEINDAGQVFISVPAKDFRGVVKIGTSSTTYHKLIIQADYFPEFLDYRVMIYLDAINFFTKKNTILSGTYNCLRLDNCKPFSAKFAMKLLPGSDDVLSEKGVANFKPVENERQLNELKTFLVNEGVYSYFFEETKNLLGELCLFSDNS